jgi:hypothetical protein
VEFAPVGDPFGRIPLRVGLPINGHEPAWVTHLTTHFLSLNIR